MCEKSPSWSLFPFKAGKGNLEPRISKQVDLSCDQETQGGIGTKEPLKISAEARGARGRLVKLTILV